MVPRACIADPELRLFQYTAIDEFTRLRFLAAYPEQSTYSSADFLRRLVVWYARRRIKVECVQTDNGSEFTNRFSNSKGRAQPPRGSEAVLLLPRLLFSGRFCKATRRTQPSF